MVKIIMEATLSFSPVFWTENKRRNKSCAYRDGKKKGSVGDFKKYLLKK